MEIEFIYFLRQLRTPWLDHFFKCLIFFNGQEFFFILFPLIWLGQGWKAGLRLVYILLLSGLANEALKDFFSFPRPYQIDPTLGADHLPLSSVPFDWTLDQFRLRFICRKFFSHRNPPLEG